jgi:UDP-N-acetylmuramate--alanine ligase
MTPALLQELTKCDVCIPVFHGPQGEDGMMGGVLDALCIPYVGCDYRTGAICMQKAWTKYVALSHNVPTAPFIEIDATTYRRDPEAFFDKVEERFAYPVWVKPVHLGSSIGVSRAANRQEMIQCAELALHYDETIIVEREIDGRQIEFSALGNEYVRLALPGEIINHGAFVAYDKKYGAGAMEIRVPAPITEIEKMVGYELAEKMYRACGCRGLARVDFFLDRKGHYWFNEINPFPGFTDTSAFPQMWTTSGMKMEQIVDEMIALALQRSRRLAEVRGKQ